MKTSILLVITVLCSLSGSLMAQNGKWEKIATNKVNFISEKDVIKFDKKIEYGAIKFKVLNSAIEFNSVVVRYTNGESEEIALRHKIAAGSETRVIPLKSGKHLLDRITFKYKGANILKGLKPTIEIWGKRK